MFLFGWFVVVDFVLWTVMEPESRRLVRAWRDEGVANQGLESEGLTFVREENVHNVHSRASTEFAFSQTVSTNGFFVYECIVCS